jgi:hypothetical protein
MMAEHLQTFVKAGKKRPGKMNKKLMKRLVREA